MFKVPEKYRVKIGSPAHDNATGNNGAFEIPHPKISEVMLFCVGTSGMGWEHVSITLSSKTKPVNRCPLWEEMCFIKDLFWDEDDTVLQYHPAKSQYVNFHPRCLHLWRPVGVPFPIPPKILIGPSF